MFGGMSPQSFDAQLSSLLPLDELTIRVHSEGGNAFAGIAIRNTIDAAPVARKVVRVEGLAASAASLFLTVGNRVEIAPGAMVMVHRAWAETAGNASDLQKTAAALETTDRAMAGLYAQRGKQTADHYAEMMAATTWLTGQEILDAGLADVLLSEAEVQTPEAPRVTAYAAQIVEHFARMPSEIQARVGFYPRPVEVAAIRARVEQAKAQAESGKQDVAARTAAVRAEMVLALMAVEVAAMEIGI